MSDMFLHACKNFIEICICRNEEDAEENDMVGFCLLSSVMESKLIRLGFA